MPSKFIENLNIPIRFLYSFCIVIKRVFIKLFVCHFCKCNFCIKKVKYDFVQFFVLCTVNDTNLSVLCIIRLHYMRKLYGMRANFFLYAYRLKCLLFKRIPAFIRSNAYRITNWLPLVLSLRFIKIFLFHRLKIFGICSYHYVRPFIASSIKKNFE